MADTTFGAGTVVEASWLNEVNDVVHFAPNYTGAVTKLLGYRLDDWVSLTDFLPASELAAIKDYTSTYDCASALQAAVDTRKIVHLCSGLIRIGSTVSFTYQGGHIIGSGYGTYGTRVKRLTDTSFGALIRSAGGGTSEATVIEHIKFEDYSGLTDTNTSPLVEIGCNDWTLRSCWLLNGYKGLYCPQASSNAHIEGNIFEACRKQAIDCYSAGLLKIVGNTFWKNTADISNPADRSATITLRKDPLYSFGTSDVTITANYFLETVYGHHIWIEGSDGITVSANFLCIASQVDAGQRDDIYIKDSSRVTVNGNTGTKLFNSYNPGNRGSRYFVNVDTGCTDIVVTGNAVEAGISGTINDPNNTIKIVLDYTSGLKLPNIASSDTRILDWYEEGTWSPTLLFGGAAVGQTYTTRQAKYTRIGNKLTLDCFMVVSAKGSSTGTAAIGGLPFTLGSTPAAWLINSDGGVTVTGQLLALNSGGSTTLRLYGQDNGTTSAQLTDAEFSTPTLRFSIECLL